jgi:hypothetical protein
MLALSRYAISLFESFSLERDVDREVRLPLADCSINIIIIHSTPTKVSVVCLRSLFTLEQNRKIRVFLVDLPLAKDTPCLLAPLLGGFTLLA